MTYYAGIDVGGTKIYALVIQEDGRILSRAKLKIGDNLLFEAVVDKMAECYHTACQNANVRAEEIEAVGIAVPSSVDIERRIIKHAPNLGWINVEFSTLLRETFKKPVFVDNDVNLGTFAAYHLGVAKGYKSIYGMFVGTGIGGGYILNGEIIRGVNNTASEVGHHIIKIGGPRCNCGQRGCLEAIAPKVGMSKYIQKLVDKQGKKTVLDQIAPNWRTNVGSSAIRKAFEKNDPTVIKALKRSAKAIGIAAGNLITLVGVDAIVIGGGVIEELGEFLLPRIKNAMQKHTFADGAESVPLLVSTLGDDAVAIGAAWFVRLPENQAKLIR